MEKDYDFSGWATKNNIKCSDGRTIMKDAFKDNDGQKVPLVWNHQHNNPDNVLGHAILENREEGVYTYCKFNNTEAGLNAKALVHIIYYLLRFLLHSFHHNLREEFLVYVVLGLVD